jgi:hypothetical protein
MVTAPGPLLSFVVGGATLALIGLVWVAASADPVGGRVGYRIE